MNPQAILGVWSFHKELKIVVIAFLIVLLLPVIAVILLTQVGIDLISDQLVAHNPMTHTIQLKNPSTGEVFKEISPNVVWPAKGIITLEFGESSKYQPLHTGIDIATPKGTPINPAINGTIIHAAEISWGFGKHIIIDHGDHLTTIYAHLDKIYVHQGQAVTTHNIIGTIGSTGWSTGNHLHFQVNIYTIPVNPRVFLGI